MNIIKLSSPETREFWEIPILFEDDHLMAVDKPAGLLVSPDRLDSKRPNLVKLVQKDIERGVPWAAKRGLTYLMNTHRLDFETSGVLVLAKNKAAFISIASQLGSEKPDMVYVALVRGSAAEEQTHFEMDAKLAPHPLQQGIIRVDSRLGKRARTLFAVRERFKGCMLMECCPLTHRPHQIPVHLRHAGFKLIGDATYGGPPLLLSRLKTGYRLKPGRQERPLLARAALHAESLQFNHPATGAPVQITAPWSKDMTVAVKYLKRYATESGIAALPEVEDIGNAS
jgi:RluA family pseudouridine synthase